MYCRVFPRQGFAWACALLATVAVGMTVRTAVAAGAPAAARPNFLIIVADDMGFSDAGCYGGEIATPNLDGLAANGLRYTQAYSTARCWPSRTCLLTGYYAQQVRADPPQGRLPQWCRVLPHYLKPLGYRSYQSGKWHLNGAPLQLHDGGFDHSYTINDHNRYFSPQKATLDEEALPPIKEGTGFYLTTAIADYAIGFLKEHATEHAQDPFCLYLAFTSPHFPLHAMQEDIDRYRDRYLDGWDAMRQRRYERMVKTGIVQCPLSAADPKTIPPWNLAESELKSRIGPGEEGYAVPWSQLTDEQKKFQALKMAIHAAMVDRMDRNIGRVLDQLRQMKVFDNTVIFFVSDNGASAEQIIRGDGHDPSVPAGSAHSFLCLGPGFSTACNTPMRLHKSWVHEGGISSPLIIHWPAGITDHGALRHTPVHFVDLIPTVVDLAGGSTGGTWNGATPAPMPGHSLVPTLTKDVAIPREYLYFHHLNNRAIRVGDWKLVSAGDGKEDGPWELYDMRTDRSEMHNLAAQQPEKVKQLSELWQSCEDQFRKQAGPPDPKPAKKAKPGKKAKPSE